MTTTLTTATTGDMLTHSSASHLEFVPLSGGSSASSSTAELCVAVTSADVGPAADRDGASESPFVVLNDAGSRACVHLGGVRSNGGSVLRRLALKVQRAVPRSGLPRERRPPTNPQIFQDWHDEAAVSRRLSTAGVLPTMYDFRDPARPPRPSDDPTVSVSLFGPRLFCRRRAIMFRPRDPSTLEPLRDCRDDALLTGLGLPAWSAGTVRFLYSPARAAAGEYRLYCRDASEHPNPPIRPMPQRGPLFLQTPEPAPSGSGTTIPPVSTASLGGTATPGGVNLGTPSAPATISLSKETGSAHETRPAGDSHPASSTRTGEDWASAAFGTHGGAASTAADLASHDAADAGSRKIAHPTEEPTGAADQSVFGGPSSSLSRSSNEVFAGPFSPESAATPIPPSHAPVTPFPDAPSLAPVDPPPAPTLAKPTPATPLAQPPVMMPVVVGRDELLAEWGTVLAHKAELARRSPQLHQTLQTEFPCYECPFSTECFPSPYQPSPVLHRRLVDYSFYEFHLLASELMPVNYDELCDRLGGRQDDATVPVHACPAISAGSVDASTVSSNVASTVPSTLPSNGQAKTVVPPVGGRLLFEASDDGSDVLEVFTLKLVAFQEAARAVLGFVAELGRPHLNLHPRHLLSDLTLTPPLGPAGPVRMPSLWNFRVRVIDPAAAVEVEGLPGMYLPPSNRIMLYCAPVLQSGLFGSRERASFTVTELSSDATGAAQVSAELRGELTDPHRFCPADRLRVLLTGLEGKDLDLTFRPQSATPSAPGLPRPPSNLLSLMSDPLTLPPATVARLRDLRGITQRDVAYVVLPMLHVPCDVHSLGQLLLRALLVNDTQDLPSVKRTLDAALARWPVADADRAGEPPLDAWQRLKTLVTEMPNGADMFAPLQVLYRARDRFTGRPTAIPERLWWESLLLGVRCLEGGPYGFCGHRGDFHPVQPAAAIEPVVQQAELLARRAYALLFQARNRHAEIRAVITAMLLSAGLPPGETAPGTDLPTRLAGCLERLESAIASAKLPSPVGGPPTNPAGTVGSPAPLPPGGYPGFPVR